MELQREKEFVSQYHYDARNLEWEKENGTPETKVDVNFQLLNQDQEGQVTSIVVIVSFMIVFDAFVISGGWQSGASFLKAQYGENKSKAGGEKETLSAVGLDYRLAKKTVLSFEYSINKNRAHLAGDQVKTTAVGLSYGF